MSNDSSWIHVSCLLRPSYPMDILWMGKVEPEPLSDSKEQVAIEWDGSLPREWRHGLLWLHKWMESVVVRRTRTNHVDHAQSMKTPCNASVRQCIQVEGGPPNGMVRSFACSVGRQTWCFAMEPMVLHTRSWASGASGSFSYIGNYTIRHSLPPNSEKRLVSLPTMSDEHFGSYDVGQQTSFGIA